MIPRLEAIVLAAGASRRLGRPKQLEEIGGETLVHRTARLAQQGGASRVVVACGAVAADVREAVADLGVDVITCEDWREGISATLRRGLQAMSPGTSGALVLLTDHLALSAGHLDRLIVAWRTDPAAAIATGLRGLASVPVILPASWWPEASSLAGDRGARDLLRRPGARVVVVEAPELERDLDEDAGAGSLVRAALRERPAPPGRAGRQDQE